MDERTDERTNEWVKCTCKNKLKMNENSISCSRSKKVERSVINYCNIYSDSFLIFDVLRTELSITVDDMIKNNLSSKTVRIPWIFFFASFQNFHDFTAFYLFRKQENQRRAQSMFECSQFSSICSVFHAKKNKKCKIH